MRETPFRFNGRTNPVDRAKVGPRCELLTGELADGDGTTAKIFLYDPIDSYGGYWGVSATEFLTALNELPAEVDKIRLHINSPGGEVHEGIAIANQLRQHKATVTGVVDGLAASAASFIAASLDELVMGPNSELMLHDAWGICIGPAADMDYMSGRLSSLSNNVASIYAAKAGGSVEDWREVMLAETWYSADESVAAGLADSVAGDVAVADDVAAAAGFDLEGMFTYPGRARAPGPAGRAPVGEGAPLPSSDYAARFRARGHAMRGARMRS